MVRTPSSSNKNGVKKGAWSQEEDDKLKGYILRYGHWNWNELPRFAGLSRGGKSCRLRWLNYLRPNVRRGNYTQEEDELIINLHKELGNKWCLIAAKLSGRTDNEIKNHWHCNLKKRARENTKTSNECSVTSEAEANYNNKDVQHETVLINDSSPKILGSSQLSPEPSSSSEASALSWDYNLAVEHSCVASSETILELNGDFWTEPFIVDTYQDDFPSTLAEGGSIFPYISYDDNVVDLFYMMMQELPEEY